MTNVTVSEFKQNLTHAIDVIEPIRNISISSLIETLTTNQFTHEPSRYVVTYLTNSIPNIATAYINTHTTPTNADTKAMLFDTLYIMLSAIQDAFTQITNNADIELSASQQTALNDLNNTMLPILSLENIMTNDTPTANELINIVKVITQKANYNHVKHVESDAIKIKPVYQKTTPKYNALYFEILFAPDVKHYCNTYIQFLNIVAEKLAVPSPDIESHLHDRIRQASEKAFVEFTAHFADI